MSSRRRPYNDGYALARLVPSHEGRGAVAKCVRPEATPASKCIASPSTASILRPTVWGGPGSVDEREPIHPLTQRIKAWSRPVEPTVGHRNVATCGLRMTLAQPKAMVKNLVSRA